MVLSEQGGTLVWLVLVLEVNAKKNGDAWWGSTEARREHIWEQLRHMCVVDILPEKSCDSARG